MSDVAMVQIGARDHYAVPNFLYQQQRLWRLYTDFHASPRLYRGRRFFSGLVRRMLSRHTDSVPGAVITHFPLTAMRLWWADHHGAGTERQRRIFHFTDLLLSQVARDMRQRAQHQGWPHSLIAFQGGSLELFNQTPEHIRKIQHQIDGSFSEYDRVNQERRAYPGWEVEEASDPAIRSVWMQRRAGEWQLANHIVCTSQDTRRSVIAQGVPPEKCSVIPLIYAPRASATPQAADKQPNRLRVLFLGTICLRKGVHDLLAALKQARGPGLDVQLTLAGHNGLLPERLHSELEISTGVTYVGMVPRDRVSQLIVQHDCLCLPSIAEAFGMVQLEALALGRPVIASTACGEVVRHEVEGLLVEPGNVEQLVSALLRLAQDSDFLRTLAVHAPMRVRDFAPEVIGAKWLPILST